MHRLFYKQLHSYFYKSLKTSRLTSTWLKQQREKENEQLNKNKLFYAVFRLVILKSHYSRNVSINSCTEVKQPEYWSKSCMHSSSKCV